MKDILKLNDRHRKFCRLFLQFGEGKKAYLEAGYQCGEKTAEANSSGLLSMPLIKEYLETLKEEIKTQDIADVTEVMKYLTRVLRKEEQEEHIIKLQDKEFEGKKCSITERAEKIKADPKISDRNKVAELLMKRYGVLNEKVSDEKVVNYYSNIPATEGEGEDGHNE